MAEFLFGIEPLIRVQQLFGPGWLVPFRAVAELGTNWGVVLAVGLAFWVRGRATAYALLAAVALEGAVHLVTNELAFTPRPDGPGLVKYESVPLSSFPSGHVVTATVLWGLLYLRGLVPLLLSVLVVGGVALSRLYLGVHFVADVLGGAGAGILLLAVFVRVWPTVEARLAGWPFRLHLAAALAALLGAAAAVLFVFGDSQYEWNSAGVVAGMAAGLPLEYRYVRYVPPPRGRLPRVAVGLAGIVPLLLLDRMTGADALTVGVAAITCAALWTVVVVPALCKGLSTGFLRKRDGESGGGG